MRIWWGYRFAKETFVYLGLSYVFLGTGGYLYNYRKRYCVHKQKRERCKFK